MIATMAAASLRTVSGSITSEARLVSTATHSSTTASATPESDTDARSEASRSSYIAAVVDGEQALCEDVGALVTTGPIEAGGSAVSGSGRPALGALDRRFVGRAKRLPLHGSARIHRRDSGSGIAGWGTGRSGRAARATGTPEGEVVVPRDDGESTRVGVVDRRTSPPSRRGRRSET